MVLVRQPQPNKATSKFDPEPYKVTMVKQSMVTAQNHNREITRNSSHFKKVNKEFESMWLHANEEEKRREERVGKKRGRKPKGASTSSYIRISVPLATPRDENPIVVRDDNPMARERDGNEGEEERELDDRRENGEDEEMESENELEEQSENELDEQMREREIERRPSRIPNMPSRLNISTNKGKSYRQPNASPK